MTTSEFDDILAGLNDAIDHAKGKDHGRRVTDVEVPVVDVQEVRLSLGLTQQEFAEAFRVSVATVRNWEQGRRIPRGPARVLLNIIAHEPDAVKRVLDLIAA